MREGEREVGGGIYETQNWPWLIIIEAGCWVTRIYYTRFSTFADV